MLGLRTNTLLFVGLLLGPAALLAWLGFAATVPLETELLRSARDELLRVGTRAASELPDRVAAMRRQREAELQQVAEELAAALPDDGFAAFAASERRVPGLVVQDASGAVLLPAPPRDLALPFLAEWPAFRAFERDPAATVAAARAFVAGSLRARALVHVGGPADSVAADLESCSAADLVAAGPRVVATLLRSARGRARLQREPGLVFAMPATEVERQHWLDSLAPAGFVGQRSRVEAEVGPVADVAVALPGGARLVRLLDARAELERLTAQDRACLVHFAPGIVGLDDPADPARFELAASTSLGPVRVVVEHAGLPDLLAAARQRQWLTGGGVFVLFVVMGFGVLLVRRALRQEAAARELRDRFLANVSHDLKTPLTSVRLHAEMLADPRLDAAARSRYAAVVQAEGARMSALVDDLLDVSALQQGRRRIEPEPVDLAAAVRSQAEAWRPLLERDGVAVRVVESTEAAALADPVAVGRILTNLLQNAARHGRPARDGGPSWIELAAGPGPRLSVRDNGPGVPAGLRERIFARFERAGAQGDGLGLGLALARELAAACSGTLHCRDDGSTLFELILPALPPEDPT
ncbi:MAG: HAMP domain-containing histidine kinase [Planctomycetes bacterium]|nr:HAMP domain-containing histidine kinase [Planctomycetota bacterium]